MHTGLGRNSGSQRAQRIIADEHAAPIEIESRFAGLAFKDAALRLRQPHRRALLKSIRRDPGRCILELELRKVWRKVDVPSLHSGTEYVDWLPRTRAAIAKVAEKGIARHDDVVAAHMQNVPTMNVVALAREQRAARE